MRNWREIGFVDIAPQSDDQGGDGAQGDPATKVSNNNATTIVPAAVGVGDFGRKAPDQDDVDDGAVQRGAALEHDACEEELARKDCKEAAV